MFMAAAAVGVGAGFAVVVGAVVAGVGEPAAPLVSAFFPQPVRTIAITIINNTDTENIFLIRQNPQHQFLLKNKTTHLILNKNKITYVLGPMTPFVVY
jgi:hypothetical protein